MGVEAKAEDLAEWASSGSSGSWSAGFVSECGRRAEPQQRRRTQVNVSASEPARGAAWASRLPRRCCRPDKHTCSSPLYEGQPGEQLDCSPQRVAVDHNLTCERSWRLPSPRHDRASRPQRGRSGRLRWPEYRPRGQRQASLQWRWLASMKLVVSSQCSPCPSAYMVAHGCSPPW